jgi:hypothetical protein
MTQSQLHASLALIVYEQLRKQRIPESVYTYTTNLASFILVNF